MGGREREREKSKKTKGKRVCVSRGMMGETGGELEANTEPLWYHRNRIHIPQRRKKRWREGEREKEKEREREREGERDTPVITLVLILTLFPLSLFWAEAASNKVFLKLGVQTAGTLCNSASVSITTPLLHQ